MLTRYCKWCNAEMPVKAQESSKTIDSVCSGCGSNASIIFHWKTINHLLDTIAALEARVKELEAELSRIKALYDEWGFADAPCPKHSKPPILPTCYGCKYEELEAERDKLKADVARLVDALREIVDMPIYYEDEVTDSLKNVAKEALAAFKEAEDD